MDRLQNGYKAILQTISCKKKKKKKFYTKWHERTIKHFLKLFFCKMSLFHKLAPQHGHVMCTWLHVGLPACAPSVFFSPAEQKTHSAREGCQGEDHLYHPKPIYTLTHLVFFKLLILWIVSW